MRRKFRFLTPYTASSVILSVSVVITERSNERSGRGPERNYRGIQVSRGTLRVGVGNTVLDQRSDIRPGKELRIIGLCQVKDDCNKGGQGLSAVA